MLKISLLQPVERLDKDLKAIASDSLFLFVKFSTLHYLVQGETFNDIHKLTQKCYEHFLEMYDFFNEKLVQRQVSPIKCIFEACEMTSFPKLHGDKDRSKRKDYKDTTEVCYKALILMESFREKLVALKEVANKERDYVVEDYCIKELYFFDKEIWTLRGRLSMNTLS